MNNMRRKKHYRVKGIAGVETYLEVMREETEGYRILIRTYTDHDAVRESEEFISFHLFDACVRTGYLTECAQLDKLAASA